eukprot:5494523-Pyramimonas_sp.AAC.1
MTSLNPPSRPEDISSAVLEDSIINAPNRAAFSSLAPRNGGGSNNYPGDVPNPCAMRGMSSLGD